MINRLMPLAGPLLRRHPRIMGLARYVIFKLWRLRVRIRTWRLSESLDVHQTYWVDPKKIKYAVVCLKFKPYYRYLDKGKVIGGNWDQNRVKFADLGILPWLEDRFVRGIPWEATEGYRHFLDRISRGEILWWCKNKDAFDKRCRYLDYMYDDIRINGYKTQCEIAQKENDPWKSEDEVTVRIDRDGALLFEDGRHRLAMAKLLNIERIPIKITARHYEWCQFRKEVLDYARNRGGTLYHPITHPDLSDMRSMHGDDRFNIIKAHLPININGGDLLDIGSHLGYFCHKFEEKGFNCWAVESDATCVYFSKKLKIAEDRKFKVIQGSIFDYREKTDFDVVLALNIFHHFIKMEDTYHKLIDLLGRLDMKVMFFETELPDSPQMKGAYRNFDCGEFVDFILQNSDLNEAVCIGRAKYGRPIYRLQAV